MKETTINLEAVRRDWKALDSDDFPTFDRVKLISHEEFSSESHIHVEYVDAGRIAGIFRRLPAIYYFLYAARLFIKSDKNSVIVVNGGITLLWLWCGLLNAFPFLGKRKLFCWDIFVEYILGREKRLRFFPFIKITTELKESIARFVLRQYGLNIVWSKKQVETHSRHFDLPDHHFIFLPFKANHSKRETYDIPMGNFVFAGGNGKRDYRCLIDAVRGTDIPVIISATSPDVRKTIEPLSNVMVLGAPEPTFAQLQAASRFVVIPMTYSGLKGGGEANFCNAMWHGKPVIAVDSMSAIDYVLDADTGYVVNSGDSRVLREKILTLWNNIELCKKMGSKGHAHVVHNFTHSQFILRLLRLALVYGASKE